MNIPTSTPTIKVTFIYNDDSLLKIASILQKKFLFKVEANMTFSFHKCPSKDKLFVQIIPLSQLDKHLGKVYSQFLKMYFSLPDTKVGLKIKENVIFDSIKLER